MDHRPTFASLQLLRGLAAFLVLLFHLRIVEGKFSDAPLLPSFLRFADAGVDLFFVISGVVMALVTRGRFASFSNAGHFLARRAWRVVPMYWIYTSLVVVLMAVLPGMVNSSYGEQSVLASYLLWPQAELPLLTVGWTLIHEMYFYLVMALVLALAPARWLAMIMLAWAALVVSAQAGLEPEAPPWARVVFNAMTLEFIAGVLLGLYWRHVPPTLARWALPIGALWLTGAMIALDRIPAEGFDYTLMRTMLFGSGSVLLVLGALAWELRDGGQIPRAWVLLGDSSYSLYLSHVFVLSAIGRIWHASGATDGIASHVAFLATAIIAALAAGLLSYHFLERPLLTHGGHIAAGWRRRLQPG